jgi:hypothetical protein
VLLRYGALDAAAHPEAAAGVLEILWKAATMNANKEADIYSRTRATAFGGLAFYEVCKTALWKNSVRPDLNLCT